MQQLLEWMRRYQRLVRSRAVPWKIALLLGSVWGLYSWMAFPVFNPLGAIQSLQYGFGWFNLIFNLVLGATLGSVLVRLGGVLLPYVAPLAALLIGSYLLAAIGLIRTGVMVCVWTFVGATVVILVWWRYVLDRRPVNCHACDGRGAISVRNPDGRSYSETTCDVCGGGGSTTLMMLSIKLTPIFAIMALGLIAFGLNALNWAQ